MGDVAGVSRRIRSLLRDDPRLAVALAAVIGPPRGDSPPPPDPTQAADDG